MVGKLFSKRNYIVLALSRQSSKFFSRTKSIIPLDIDITIKRQIIGLNRFNFDLCIHAASDNKKFSKESFPTNVVGTFNLLNQLIDKSPNTRIIYLSTFQVYGKVTGVVNEKHSLSYRDDYTTYHICAEALFKRSILARNTNCTILRLTNTYGFNAELDCLNLKNLISIISRQMLERGEINLISKHEELKDYINLDDLCSILENILFREDMKGIFNVSSNHTYSNIDIANAARVFFEKKNELVSINFQLKKLKEGSKLLVENKKIKKFIELNFQDKVLDTLEKLIETYSKD